MALFSSDRVLVPFDFSEDATTALVNTVEFVGDASRVYVLHVLLPLEPTEPGNVWETIDNDTRISNVKQVFQGKFGEPQYQALNLDVAIGDPATKIIEYATDQSIDLIVIPSRGRTGLSRFFMGSVAERVARMAHCPVLVLRH